MSMEDRLQQNIRRTTGLRALRQISAIVEDENQSDVVKARSLRWILRYGWILLLAVGVLLGYLTGVY